MKNKIAIVALCAMGLLLPMHTEAAVKTTKEQKELIKTLKKEKGYKDADFKEENGFRYILIEVEKQKYIVADVDGNTLFDASAANDRGYSDIMYVSAHDRNRNNYHYKKSAGLLGLKSVETNGPAFYTGNPSLFIAQTSDQGGQTDFYLAKDGTKIATIDGNVALAPHLPVLIINPESERACGVATFDGKVLVNPEYSAIDPQSEGVCYFSNDIDGVKYVGAVDVREDDPQIVPCLFYSITREGDDWYVQPHEFYAPELYQPDAQYEISYVDTGEKYYAQGEYSKCHDYYTLRAPEAEWAPFYIAVCERITAADKRAKVDELIKKLNKTDAGKGEKLVEELKTTLSEYETSLREATSSFDKYSKSGSNEGFLATAKTEGDSAFEEVMDIDKVKTSVAEAIKKYDTKVAEKAKKDKEKQAKEELKKKEKESKKATSK